MYVSLYALMKIFNSIQILSIYSTFFQKRKYKGESKNGSYVFRVFSVVLRFLFLNGAFRGSIQIPSLLEKEFRTANKVNSCLKKSGEK